MMMSLPLCSIQVCAAPTPVGLEVGFEDPEQNGGNPQRGPVVFPEVSIEDNFLTFTTFCYGWTLELINEDDQVVYTAIITSDTLVLPSTLCGDYQLRLIPNDSSNIYFYGYVLF